jgi:hypothetical protein
LDNKTLLKIINAIAVLLPFLAKSLEKFTDSLLAKTETSKDIISKRFQDNEYKRIVDSVESSKNLQPVLEESLSSTVNDSLPIKSAEASKKETQSASSIDNTAISTQEITLRQIEQDFQDSRERKLKALQKIHAQEDITFKFMLIFALVALVFIVWGGYIIFQQGFNIIVVLVEFIGLVGGAGTLILRQLQDRLKDKADVIDREQDQQTKYLRTIQAALALTGSERETQLAETAKWLRESQ